MESLDALIDQQIRPLKRSEYETLAEAGAFRDEHVELVYGRIVKMSPQGDLHSFVIRRLNMILAPALVGRADVSPQLPFAASDISLPEPDLAVVGVALVRHPSEASLVVEVADSSLAYDRRVKARLYAEAGIPEYWIIDVRHGVVEVHRAPAEGKYLTVTQHAAGEQLSLLAFPDVVVRVAEVLPPRG